MAYLEVAELTVRAGGFVLGPVSFSLERGEHLIVLGPSGGGKTTLLKALAGLLRPEGGTLAIDGRDMTAEGPATRRVGYVPQAATLFPHLAVWQNIAFGLDNRGSESARNRVEEMANLLGVGTLLERKVRGLSGGEAKRVALARALAPAPSLLLLDEPLGMLDHNAREEMAVVLRNLRDLENVTALHVTHDREEAWNMRGSCAVMMDGKLLRKGRTAEVFRSPGSATVARFLGARNVFAVVGSVSSADRVANLGWWQVPLAEGSSVGAVRYAMIAAESLVPVARGTAGSVTGLLLDVTDRGAYTELSVRPAGSDALLYARLPVGAPVPAAGEEMTLSLTSAAVALAE